MTEATTLDEIDATAASVYEGYVVRKDLAQQFKGAYPVPTYVGEFLIGRYCATTDQEEIEEGLQVVRRLLADRTVRAGEEELFKSRARERMTVKLIDLVKARLDAKSNSYLAELPSLGLRDVRIDDAVVRDNERMLTGGFYAEVDLYYDAAIAEENNGKPFAIGGLRPSSSPLVTRFPTLRRDVPGLPLSSGSICSFDLLVSSLSSSQTASRMFCFCEWFRLFSATTTWSSSVPVAPVNRTSINRSRHTLT